MDPLDTPSAFFIFHAYHHSGTGANVQVCADDKKEIRAESEFVASVSNLGHGVGTPPPPHTPTWGILCLFWLSPTVSHALRRVEKKSTVGRVAYAGRTVPTGFYCWHWSPEKMSCTLLACPHGSFLKRRVHAHPTDTYCPTASSKFVVE